jgi:hypothetical protein
MISQEQIISLSKLRENAINSNRLSTNISTKKQEKATNNNSTTSFKEIAKEFTKVLLTQLAASYTGIPQLSPIINNAWQKVDATSDKPLQASRYSTSPFNQLNNIPGVPYNDFRSRKSKVGYGISLDTRIDGLAASITAAQFDIGGGVRTGAIGTLKRYKSAAYAAASAGLPGGVYSVFNLDSAGTFGYGWGSHGDPNAVRFDFTLRSHVTTAWSFGKSKWTNSLEILRAAIPFRGDKVNVTDFKKSSLRNIYRWRTLESVGGKLKNIISQLGQTQDFIKFYFTGPKLSPAMKNTNEEDDVIVFRATISSITDSFQPQWSPISMIGRADQNYHYTSFSRDMNFDFTVYATDRDELKPIYRKLNALAGYTAPDYSAQNNIGLVGPWMRVTIGDLFYQVPVVISSLSYTLGGDQTPWEINIEDDGENMQVPLSVQVSISLSVISEWLPEKGGQFYTLSKRFDEFGSKPGNDNWLSDTVTVASRPADEETTIRQTLEESAGIAKKKIKEIFSRDANKDIGNE